MKVLVFTNLYPNHVAPNYGVFVKERMTHFAELKGCSIKVVAPVPYYPLNFGWRSRFNRVARYEVRDGIEVYHPRFFMTPKFGMMLYGWMMFLSVLPIVTKIQKHFDFDLIDAHYVYPDGFAAIQLGRFFNRPVVVSARGSDINLFRTLHLIPRLLRYVLFKADRVIAVSQALKSAIVEMGVVENKIVTIPNGVNVESFYPFEKESARKALALPNRKTIVSVGSLTDNKGFELLIKAFRRLLDSFDADLQLAIVGDGPSRAKLEKLIASLELQARVRLVGAVPHDELRLWYCAADLSCLASAQEGWPNVVLESLACGVPVVATSVGGIPEIIASNAVGLLTARNERDIADALGVALNRNWRPQEIAAYAAEHTWQCTATKLLNVFHAVLERGALEKVAGGNIVQA